MAMVGQKCFDASIGDELSTKSCRVEELRIGLAVSLHSRNSRPSEPKSQTPNGDYFNKSPSVLED